MGGGHEEVDEGNPSLALTRRQLTPTNEEEDEHLSGHVAPNEGKRRNSPADWSRKPASETAEGQNKNEQEHHQIIFCRPRDARLLPEKAWHGAGDRYLPPAA